MNYYIFVVSDSEYIDGTIASGYNIAIHRLENKIWPLYRGTRNRLSIAAEDRALIYIGGSKQQSGKVIGSCSIKRVERKLRRFSQVDPDNILTEPAEMLLHIGEIEIFCLPKHFRDVLPKLDCKPRNMQKWGVILLGGLRRISKNDYFLLRP